MALEFSYFPKKLSQLGNVYIHIESDAVDKY